MVDRKRFRLKNFSLEKFNRDVNLSGNLDEKFRSWAQYRSEISLFIGKALEIKPDMKSVAVFGAGNLNDLDMNYVCANFEKIILTDTDIKSIQDGLSRQKLGEKELLKIDIIKADYTGESEAGLFCGLEKLSKRAASADEIITHIRAAFSYMENIPAELPVAEGADLVISCPVYTQLIFTQIEVFLKILYEYGLYEYNELNRMLNFAYSGMPGIIRKYNRLLFRACKKNGLIILLSDIIEMEKRSGTLGTVRTIMGSNRPDIVKIEKQIKKHGVELVQIGRDDFIGKTDPIESFYTIWPFNAEKEYLVCGYLAASAEQE